MASISLSFVFNSSEDEMSVAVTPMMAGPTSFVDRTGLSVSKMSRAMIRKTMNAITHPAKGEMTQLETTFPTTLHSTAFHPPASIPNPMSAPMTECVVDIGISFHVERVTQSAAASSDATNPSMRT